MEVSYGSCDTYKYVLSAKQLEYLGKQFNRSKGQSQFLFQLVDGDFDKLVSLEMKIKNCFVSYCPGDVETVEAIMNMEVESDWFKLKIIEDEEC
jgi:hypothetical protein